MYWIFLNIGSVIISTVGHYYFLLDIQRCSFCYDPVECYDQCMAVSPVTVGSLLPSDIYCSCQ